MLPISHYSDCWYCFGTYSVLKIAVLVLAGFAASEPVVGVPGLQFHGAARNALVQPSLARPE